MNLLLSVMVLLNAAADAAGAQSRWEGYFDARKHEWAATMDRTSAVRFEGHLWEFTANPDGPGLLVRIHGAQARQFVLSCDDALGQVIALEAATREDPDQMFIAVAVACVPKEGDRIEYRLLQGGRNRGSLDEEKSWLYTKVLLTQPLDRPHELLGAAALGGDSIVMTVQFLERGAEDYRVVTHSFFSNCPFGGFEGGRTFGVWQYTATAEKRVAATPAGGS
ncbi:MAG: hypothetical protein BroJett003_10740 [Planctomycetota bacterium]|nr:MAG: hypothetical protein BroJett003_10740 [Planctomycetota bacterium]